MALDLDPCAHEDKVSKTAGSCAGMFSEVQYLGKSAVASLVTVCALICLLI